MSSPEGQTPSLDFKPVTAESLHGQNASASSTMEVVANVIYRGAVNVLGPALVDQTKPILWYHDLQHARVPLFEEVRRHKGPLVGSLMKSLSWSEGETPLTLYCGRAFVHTVAAAEHQQRTTEYDLHVPDGLVTSMNNAVELYVSNAALTPDQTLEQSALNVLFYMPARRRATFQTRLKKPERREQAYQDLLALGGTYF